MPLDSQTLTDHQWAMCANARSYPVIITSRGMALTAGSLARHGWGDVEDGASGERIFRLNQAGCDEMAWLDELAEPAHDEPSDITEVTRVTRTRLKTGSQAGTTAPVAAHSPRSATGAFISNPVHGERNGN